MEAFSRAKGNLHKLSAGSASEISLERSSRLCFLTVAGFAALIAALPAAAADLPDPQAPPRIDPFMMNMAMDDHVDHSKIPAGVYGAGMVPAGGFMLSYTPVFMHMEDNYIGSSIVSPQTIVTTIPSNVAMTMPGMMGKTIRENYRIAPTFMDVQMHMAHAMYGITDWLNVMVMSSYQQKSMTMITYAGAAGAKVLGWSSSSTEGFGDTMLNILWRLYQDQNHQFHLNLGLSLPSGSTTESVTMLSPMGRFMTMRAVYGMQLGTGTVDFLPGATYKGQLNQWSWGAAYRGRLALDNNSEGYHYGYQHELTGWGGYTWIPGVTTTARVAGSIQDLIHGSDPMISGLMQATNPRFYGGKRIELFGGLEVDGAPFGLGHTHIALEGGGPLFQELNGPQLGRAWQINLAARIGF